MGMTLVLEDTWIGTKTLWLNVSPHHQVHDIIEAAGNKYITLLWGGLLWFWFKHEQNGELLLPWCI